MQAAWQKAYSSDVTGNGYLLCLHQFQFKRTACIHYVHYCGSCEDSPKAVCYASGPATVKESLCSATVAAPQPFSVLYERFHKIQQPTSCWQLCVLPLSGLYKNDLQLHLTLATGQGQPHHRHTNCSMQQSSSQEGNQFTTSQDIPSVLRNPMVPCHIFKSPPPVPTLRHINQGSNY